MAPRIDDALRDLWMTKMTLAVALVEVFVDAAREAIAERCAFDRRLVADLAHQCLELGSEMLNDLSR